MTDIYTPEEQTLLLAIARHTLEAITANETPPLPEFDDLPPALTAERACFVTMRRREDGTLRGCTGTLVARRPLVREVIQMTIQTARHDPRFYPVEAHEIAGLHLEISVLTPPEPLDFDGPDDLLNRLRPSIDGVTLQLDTRRATFLPQVWNTYPDPTMFLSLLSEKMGRGPAAWRDPNIEVEIYEAVIIEEPE
jgi:AmmeMemoRadiSam system protein A